VRLELVPAEGAFTPQDISFAFKEQKIDYLIFLASPRFCAIKELEKFKGNKPIINIDFHKENDLYGDFNWSVQQAVSIAEVLLGLTEALEGVKGEKLHGADLATLLYTCLFWATNGLRGEVPSRAFSVAAQLISWGADKKRVEEAFEKRWPIDFFMFLAQIWQNAEIQNQKLISHIDFKQGQRGKWERLQKHIAREIKNRSPNIDSLFLLYSNNQATKLYAYVDDESQISNIPVTEWLFKKPPVFSGVLKMPIDKAKEKLKEILF